MFKPAISLISIVILASFSSCITSFHQLVTHDKVITDKRMAGTWQQNGKSVITIEEFAKSNLFKNSNKASVNKEETKLSFDSKEDSLLYSKSYMISFSKSACTYYMPGSLIRLNNELYVDILPITSVYINQPARDTTDLFNNFDYLPSHTIAKLVFHDNNMEIKFLDGAFIRKQMNNGAIAIKYEEDRLFQTSLITASAADLQQFLIKYGRDGRLYSPENTIILKKI